MMLRQGDRPQGGYREIFRSQLLSAAPATVLDVGAGHGGLLAWLAENGVTAAGLENDPACVGQAVAEGLDVREGSADALPFDDDTFDWVVSEFSLHHFTNAGKALSEAMRVCRKGVLVLDQWYDVSLPHQRAARDFDNWCKERDRCAGMVHAESYSVDAVHTLVANVAPHGGYRLQTMVTPVAYADEAVQGTIDGYLQAHNSCCCQPSAGLEALRQQIAADGISDDGALILTMWK